MLGSGADVCYPAANWKLLQPDPGNRRRDHHEFLPGCRQRQDIFLQETGIISALTDVVLIVAWENEVGSLITAGFASLIRERQCMPFRDRGGSDSSSQGRNQLDFLMGAGIAQSPEILLGGMGDFFLKRRRQQEKKKNLGPARDLELVCSCLIYDLKTWIILFKKTGFSSRNKAGR